MTPRNLAQALASLALLTACGKPGFENFSCKDAETAECVEVAVDDDTTSLLEVVNSLFDDTTVVLGAGTWSLDNQVTIRNADNVVFRGQGIDESILDFDAMTVQANGVDAVADGFTIQDLTIQNAVKDGLRIEDSSDVVIRRVKTTWTGGPSPENGGYGLYPVKSTRVLMEDSEAYHSSDAGIYVGQCVEAVVRNNIAKANVAGLEIENTQYADVYGNLVEDNTGGLVVFDLPGNPIVGRDVYIHDNIIRANNRPNFAPGGTVAQIPAGTGTFAMASRRVEITGNTYENNQSLDVAIISGLVIEGDPMKWANSADELVGGIEGLTLDTGPDGEILNFRTTDVYVHGNTHSGGGTRPDNSSLRDRPLGYLIAVTYAGTPVDSVIYDAVGESSFSPTEASGNSNDNHICVGDDPGVTFASLDIENLSESTVPSKDELYRPAAPFAPFDCTALTGGPIVRPTFAD